MAGAATLTVKFTGETTDLERKAKRARDVVEGPMKDLQKSPVWGQVSGKASRAGQDAGDKFSSGMHGKVKSGAGKLGGLVKLGLVGVAAKLGLDFGQEFMSAMSGASDLEQSTGGLKAIFKKDFDEMKALAEGAATSLGLSTNSYQELATTLGAGLKNKGITDFADETERLIGLGADLSAQFGGSTQEAVDAISSLMRGESDPIERYGVAINETAINAELAAKGQDKLTGSALEQAKAQARVELLFRQTADAQGTFAKESDTLAGKQQRAGALWENLKTKMGEKFLPAASNAMGWFVDKGIPGMEKFLGVAESAVGGVWDLVTKGDFTSALSDTFGIEEDSAVIAWFLDLRDTVSEAWGGIQDAIDEAWTVIEPIASEIWSFLVDKWGEIGPEVTDTFDTIQRAIGKAMEAIAAIIQRVTDWIAWVWDNWGDNIMTGIGIAFDLISGLFNGFYTTIEGIWTTLTGILTGDWEQAGEGIRLIAEGLGTALGSIWEGIKAGALNAWDAMAKGIGKIWDGIKSIVAKPINVVIGFINDGIIGSYNWVAEKLGLGTLGKIPRMQTSSSSSGRGSTGGRTAATAFANGGYVDLPWNSTDRDPYLGRTPRGEFWFEGEEFIFPRSMARRHRRSFEAMLRGDLEIPGYAGGGTVRPVSASSSGWNGGRYRSGGWHGGLDFPAATGTPISAMWDGTVARALRLSTSYGHHAILDHGDGLQTLYAHMSQLLATTGQMVRAGAHIGDVGSTGNSTGPHLHLEVRKNGRQVNPEPYLDGAGGPSKGFLAAIAAGFQSVKDWFGGIMDRVAGAWGGLTDVGGGIFGDLVTGIGDKLRGDLSEWVRGKLGYASGGTAGAGLSWVGERGPELLDLRGGERIWTLAQLRRGAGQASSSAAVDVDDLVGRIADAIRDMPQPQLVMAEGDIRRVVQSEIRRGRGTGRDA